MTKKNRVILVHGLNQAPFIMRPLAKRLQAKGYDTHQYGYRSRHDGLKVNSARLDTWLKANHIPEQPIDLIGHSLGGLVIRDFVATYPQWQIGRCVTLGTPHNGSVWADYIWRFMPAIVGRSYIDALDGTVAPLPKDIKIGVIAGDKTQGLGQTLLSYHNRKLRKADIALTNKDLAHDGTVYVTETKLASATDHIIMPVTHTGMLIKKNVAAQAIYFLENGNFR
ncbi:esterase/lipase family protein, partial [Psychrobacter sp. AOP3-A1-26]|uniref:esterase/lipase family protein n=1 Tax=Psychrobacter sp. AOP3-A1-26 TaxID=3457700 RepID=UPI004036FE15